MFYDIFARLCREKGVTPSKAATEMGMNRSTVTFWKSDTFKPRQDTLQKVANYFGVSISTLLDINDGDSYPDFYSAEESKKKEPTVESNSGLTEEEQALIALFRRVPKESRGLVLDLINAALKNLK